jgi:DNA-binding response OmpR family regulator
VPEAKTILLVDDEPDILKVTSFRLRKAGFNVAIAKNGKQALQIAGREKPALIVLDLGLPDIDGNEVCHRLKANKKLKMIPVIIFTGKHSADLLEGPLALPVEDYLIKPYDAQELLVKIKKLLARKRRA